MDLDGRETGEDLGGVGRENRNWNILYGKRSNFNKNRNK